MAMETAIKTKKIDADSHFLPRSNFGDLRTLMPGFTEQEMNIIIRDTETFADPNARRGGFRATAAGQRTGGGDSTISQGVSASRRSGPIGHGEAQDRVTLLPETGFDMQVLIPDGIFANPFGSPLGRPRDPAVRLALCKAFNNASAAAQDECPDHLIGTAVIPFQDVEESCIEARRAVEELNLKAITINGNWAGKNYDSLELYPFWRTVSELDVPLYVHHNPFQCQVNDHVPTTYTIGWERYNRMHVSNYLGFAFEYMLGMASLTLGGVLNEFPDLKFVFFEAGGQALDHAPDHRHALVGRHGGRRGDIVRRRAGRWGASRSCAPRIPPPRRSSWRAGGPEERARRTTRDRGSGSRPSGCPA